MTELNIRINTDGAAFHPNEHYPHPDIAQVSGLLSEVARKVHTGDIAGALIDSNGNTVGEWTLGERYAKIVKRKGFISPQRA